MITAAAEEALSSIRDRRLLVRVARPMRDVVRRMVLEMRLRLFGGSSMSATVLLPPEG